MGREGTEKAGERSPFRECRGTSQSAEHIGVKSGEQMFHTAEAGSERAKGLMWNSQDPLLGAGSHLIRDLAPSGFSICGGLWNPFPTDTEGPRDDCNLLFHLGTFEPSLS